METSIGRSYFPADLFVSVDLEKIATDNTEKAHINSWLLMLSVANLSLAFLFIGGRKKHIVEDEPIAWRVWK